MISLQYFANISIPVSLNNTKLDISKIYTKWDVEKCPRWNFQIPWKPRNSKNKTETTLLCWRLRFQLILRLSQPSLSEVWVGAELGNIDFQDYQLGLNMRFMVEIHAITSLIKLWVRACGAARLEYKLFTTYPISFE